MGGGTRKADHGNLAQGGRGRLNGCSAGFLNVPKIKGTHTGMCGIMGL